MKSVLMIAYHFPPLAGSSGIQRTLCFARHLPEFGWKPIVLTAHPRAYAYIDDTSTAEHSQEFWTIRAPAWDAARHLSIHGRYPRVLARPDRWSSWWLGAVPAGLVAIRRYRPDVIWSTYPIATAHRIGHTLACASRLPWIADFRDPMAQDDYPTDPAQWRSFLSVEQAAIRCANLSTFTAPGAAALYRQRYPKRVNRMQVIENGYDEASFETESPSVTLNPGRLTLLHSGIVYPSERDPTQLMQALAILKRESPQVFARLLIRFRAPVHDDLLRDAANRCGAANAIEILPPIRHREAIAEMRSADGLLILQARNCNRQIPAKFYEYLASQRPLLVLTDPEGDTAHAARAIGVDAIAPLDDASAIASLLQRWAANPEAIPRPSQTVIANTTRRARTAQLADWLDRLSAARWHGH
ncbi:MAG: glycosyltransferase [Chromatiales bacterium]|nr:glycosyltransferase [Chromatiales bacterium]